jgi:hypothetical protein
MVHVFNKDALLIHIVNNATSLTEFQCAFNVWHHQTEYLLSLNMLVFVRMVTSTITDNAHPALAVAHDAQMLHFVFNVLPQLPITTMALVPAQPVIISLLPPSDFVTDVMFTVYNALATPPAVNAYRASKLLQTDSAFAQEEISLTIFYNAFHVLTTAQFAHQDQTVPFAPMDITCKTTPA